MHQIIEILHRFEDIKKVVKSYVITVLLKNDKKIFENDIDILTELILFNGYDDTTKDSFYSHILNLKLRGSVGALNNTLTYFANEKFIIRSEKNKVTANPEFFEKIENTDKYGLVTKLYYANTT